MKGCWAAVREPPWGPEIQTRKAGRLKRGQAPGPIVKEHSCSLVSTPAPHILDYSSPCPCPVRWYPRVTWKIKNVTPGLKWIMCFATFFHSTFRILPVGTADVVLIWPARRETVRVASYYLSASAWQFSLLLSISYCVQSLGFEIQVWRLKSLALESWKPKEGAEWTDN